MKHNSIEVSVICITYNQEKYLETAIESILSQKTDFTYEIIVHEDVSNDGTREIIQSYMKEHPAHIIGIFEKKNQYSQGKDFFSALVTDVAKGKYIALCEGDDFWIDDNKLQKQWEALESHPECDMCACWGTIVSEDGANQISQIRPRTGDGLLAIEDVIMGGGLYLATAGLFFRKSMYDEMMPFEKVLSMDYTIQMKGALRGGIYYIDQKMAAYRRYSEGSWTNNVLTQPQKLKEHWKRETSMLRTLDEDTKGKYHEVIEERLKAYIPFEEQLNDNRAEILSLMERIKGSRYIWGMGRRGRSLELYFNENEIQVDGVCDAVNKNIGSFTEFGNKIFSTEEVLQRADNILVSSSFAYRDLIETDFSGTIYNFQEYMPYG